MKHLPFIVLALGAIGSHYLRAQTTATSEPAAAAAESREEMVELSPFLVSSESTGRYQASEATSGTRVRISLLDSTQSVSVVTRDLIDDIGAGRMIDAAKYVAGVYESTIPNAQDRTTIRGFQSDGATVDGFSYFSFANLDPVIVDRIEVVKGPNAIMAPQGVPGGTLNNVSKKPLFINQGYMSGQIGLYASNRAELDVNRVLQPDKLSFRVAAAVQDADDYGKGNFHKSAIAMPMFTYRFAESSQLTVQATFSSWRALNFGGLPISLYSGSNDRARLLDHIHRDYILQRGDIPRQQTAAHVRAFFTANLTENLSMRIAANGINSHGRSVQMNIGAASNQVLTLDPSTGLWSWNGTTRNDDPEFPIGGSVNTQHRNYANWQNDFVYDYKGDRFKSSTVWGYAFNYSVTYHEKNQNFSVPTPQTLPVANYTPYTLTNITGINTRYFRDQQVYAYEVLSLFDERLILSGGVSRNWYFSHNFDVLLNRRATHQPNATLPSGGVVFKLRPGLALYYGYSKQTTAINPSTTATNFFTTQTSRQHEGGIRLQAFDDRLYTTLAYFDIQQNNFSVPNPLNSAVPVPNPQLPPLFSNRVAHGIELEIHYAVNKNLSLIGNATSMKNRDADDLPFRGTAEKSAALWINYAFNNETAFKGLSVGVGADHLSRRPGDTASGVTSASTPDRVIRIRPSFWLPARTLVSANVAYRVNEHWKGQLNFDNVFNEQYLMSSTARTSVWPGTPFNARLTVIYNF